MIRHSIPFVFLALAACAAQDPCLVLGTDVNVCWDTSDLADDAGGDGTVLSLPFPAGTDWRCTQGTGGSYSHFGNSTLYGIDFDTSNDTQQEVYAPIGGTAYVHTESATSGFGYHVSIDVGGGSYAILGHLSSIFIEDGAEVAAGELIGYEGCTGNCTGDHVHIGLLEGDPTEPGQDGWSVNVAFRTLDTDAGDADFSEINADELECGLTSGHVYESDLSVPEWHPDGTLVKVPNDPKVYLLQDGSARWISNETVFWSYGYDFDNLTLVSDEELACYGVGDDISDEGELWAGYGEDGEAWLFAVDADGSAWKQSLASDGRAEVLASWGLDDIELDESDLVSWDVLGRYDTRSGSASFRDGSVVKEEGRSDVYVISDGAALPVKDWETYLLLGFGSREILTVEDGLVATVMDGNVGSCSAGIWCLDTEAVTACGGGLELGSGEEGGASDGSGDVPDRGDEDEDPGGCTDADDDGWCSESTGGTDCADHDETVHPEAEDICGNGVDEDCSGTDAACPDSETDTDGDGIMDDVDNCPLHDNADQSDADGDGVGDACDTDGVSVESEGSEESGDGVSVESEASEESGGEEDDVGTAADPWSAYLYVDDPYLCFSSEGFRSPYDAADAYAVGYGTGLGWTLSADDLVVPDEMDDGYFCLDTTEWEYDDYELTLLSSIRSDGSVATTYLDTGDWWDNYDYCTSGSDAALAFCVSEGGYDYLVGVTKSMAGLFPNGDGA